MPLLPVFKDPFVKIAAPSSWALSEYNLFIEQNDGSGEGEGGIYFILCRLDIRLGN